MDNHEPQKPNKLLSFLEKSLSLKGSSFMTSVPMNGAILVLLTALPAAAIAFPVIFFEIFGSISFIVYVVLALIIGGILRRLLVRILRKHLYEDSENKYQQHGN